ncbi:MAG: hypothetical protein GTN70_09435 [Deltaproteobacteria bacterium]|nr:hypothetical protein [Deltaproteobacteria bacterium]NIS77999.1 hypothetical protein [Deltaproteobacteria bacterium]
MRTRTIILSDLHLSEGWDPETCRISRIEDFFFDEAFTRFLHHLKSLRKEDEKIRIIINGDFADFLQFKIQPEKQEVNGEAVTAREIRYGLGTSTFKTLWKLNVLFEGHWKFFGALADFLSAGNELVIVPGNHDIEWMIPEVQDAFRRKMSELTDSGEISEKITFSPWFYYDSDVSLFVEHGNQYDPLNSFDYLLHPYREDGTIDLPAGSFFVRYLFNEVEMDYPFADNMKPVSRFFRWVLFHPLSWLKIPTYLNFFFEIFKKAGPMDPAWKEKQERKQREILEEMSEKSGLGVEILTSLKKLWVPSAIHNERGLKLLRRFLLPGDHGRDYYRRKAREIQRITGGRYVVFGHTHEADLVCLAKKDRKKIEYFNSGTWTKSFASNHEEMLLKEENEFACVEVRYDVSAADYKMNLLRWNDSISGLERVRLFKEK